MTQDSELNDSAIAVVGMAGRFPDARNVDQFWRNVRDGRESVRPLSDDALRAAGVPAALLEDPHYVKAGVELPDMEKFDAGFFGLSPLDASIMDPQHRHFLECCWELLESTGYDPAGFPGSIGVFAGSGHNAYMPRNLLTNPDLVDQVGFFLLRHTSNDKDFLTTRASYQLDLRGPSVNVQTACSTSLVAVHMACQSLLSGECDMALAGAVTIELPHRRGYLTREGEILSTDGHCRPFEARSNGTLFGSAVALVALRRVEDAQEDGDTILAVIRGSAINNDGSGKVGYLAPSVDGQAAAIAEAIQVAEVDAASIGFVEAHGTGTAVGDPIEVAALTQAFGELSEPQFCALGSVKSNIGHTDTAAGVVGMIKAIQAMRHQQLPPTLHFEQPNPQIDFASSPFYVSGELAPWPSTATPRRAGVSSLGVGGTNAHLVLEESPARSGAPSRRALQILPLSARSEAALENATDRLADHLREHPDLQLADVAYTLQRGRRGFERRRFVVAADVDAAVRALDGREGEAGRASLDPLSVTFMFPGGGAQHPNMGRGLYDAEPIYRRHVDELLATLDADSQQSLRGLLFPAPGAEESAARELQRPSLQLPLIFITEYALARLWMSWGLEPTALIGHSMGENTAACLAGVLRPADALALVSLRGRLFEQVPAGGMLSISMEADAVRERLGPELCVASVNAPGLCVASGPRAALDALARELEAQEIATQHIQIDIAAHSEMLDPILEEWGAFLRGLELSPPKIPFVSNLSGTWIRDEEATDPDYWVRHLRGCVRFADGVACLLEDPRRALLEVGPGRTLATLAGMQAGPERLSTNSMRHPEDTDADLDFLVGALGRLWLGGVEVDWRAFHGTDERLRIPLPTYPFEHERHWIEPGTALHDEGAPRGELTRHEDITEWFYTPAWKRTPTPTALKECSPVLLYTDSSPLAEALADRLREVGVRVVTVGVGQSFERPGPDAFTIRPASAEDAEGMLEALAGEGCTPRVIAHLWNIGPAPDAERMLDVYQRERDLGFSSLLALAQALGSQDITDPIELVALSSGMQQVGSEIPSAPLRALMLGPCRVIGAEYPNIRCRSVDLELPKVGSVEQGRLVAQLVAELGSTSSDQVVAYRGARRLAQTFEPTPLAEPGSDAPLRERGVYLITGGLGGLGGRLAEHLARKVGARLVLLGRSELPDREAWPRVLDSRPASDRSVLKIRRIQAIEAAGGEVLCVRADVCDRDALRGVIAQARERFGTLHGVYHTAGVLDDALSQMKSLDESERVLAPKVRGTLALAEATRGLALDFFALYSSVSALAGLPGQIDYAAASSFLDAFARHRSALGEGPTVSIGWGPWQQVGMAAELARAERVAAGQGEAEPLGHALLENYFGEIPGAELYATDFSAARHWLLDEHRLAEGDALIPGTGYLELARAALGSRPEERAVELSDIFLAAPFMVPDEGDRQLRLQLDRESGEFVFLSGTPGAPDEIEHVRGVIRYCDPVDARKHPLAEIRGRCEPAEAGRQIAHTESHLRFGPRWDCIRQLAYGDAEAVADLALPEVFASDLPGLHLHPALLDMATGCAHALMPGYDPKREFCVPMSYSRVYARGPLPPSFVAHIRLRPDTQGDADFAVFDVSLMDDDGNELACFEEFMVKRIQSRGDLVAAAVELATATHVEADEPEAPQLTDDLAEATRPEEGLAALDRLLAAGPLEHVIVLPHDLSAWIAHASAAHAPPVLQAAGPSVSPELLAELIATEEVLTAHEAVAQAVMTAHFDRPGQTRRLAHIVWDVGQHVTVSELRRYLRERVADDLLPQNFVEIEEVPRSPDGGIDRDALDDPYGIADDYLPPRSSVEKTIARVWQETLRIDRVGLHDNFFDIGGHSLLAMRAIVRTEKKLGVRLNNAIMVLQTLEQVAAECAKRMPDAEESEPADEASDPAADPKTPSLSSRLLRAVRRG